MPRTTAVLNKFYYTYVLESLKDGKRVEDLLLKD